MGLLILNKIYAIITTKRKRRFIMAEKTDYVNERVNIAQQEILKRAKRLERIARSTQGKKHVAGLREGIELVREMIENQSKLYDVVVFDTPKTNLEQHRNLMLMTGGMDQSVQEGIKAATGAIDSMLDAIEQMAR
jgi:hypothetical protein